MFEQMTTFIRIAEMGSILARTFAGTFSAHGEPSSALVGTGARTILVHRTTRNFTSPTPARVCGAGARTFARARGRQAVAASRSEPRGRVIVTDPTRWDVPALFVRTVPSSETSAPSSSNSGSRTVPWIS